MMEEERWKIRADIAVEFLEVAFHSILYYRHVYPRAIFCLKRKYQIPVHVSRHPEVNNYLSECLKTIQWLLENNGVKRIVFAIVSEDEEPLERFCFEVDEPSGSETPDGYFVRTEETFREYLLKLSVSQEEEPSAGNKSFRVEIGTREQCTVRLNENPDLSHFPWVQADVENKMDEFRIFPLKSLESSELKMNMYVEKSGGNG